MHIDAQWTAYRERNILHGELSTAVKIQHQESQQTYTSYSVF